MTHSFHDEIITSLHKEVQGRDTQISKLKEEAVINKGDRTRFYKVVQEQEKTIMHRDTELYDLHESKCRVQLELTDCHKEVHDLGKKLKEEERLNVALRDAVVIYPLEHPSRTEIDVLREAREFHRHAFEDFVEYGRLRSIFHGHGYPNKNKFELPWDIFVHYFTSLPPRNSPLSEWAEQKHIIEQKKDMKAGLPDE